MGKPQSQLKQQLTPHWHLDVGRAQGQQDKGPGEQWYSRWIYTMICCRVLKQLLTHTMSVSAVCKISFVFHNMQLHTALPCLRLRLIGFFLTALRSRRQGRGMWMRQKLIACTVDSIVWVSERALWVLLLSSFTCCPFMRRIFHVYSNAYSALKYTWKPHVIRIPLLFWISNHKKKSYQHIFCTENVSAS